MIPGETEQVPARSFGAPDIDPEEEARRLCQVAVATGPATGQLLLIRVGVLHTTAVRADGDRMMAFRILSHGPVILAAAQGTAARASGAAAARLLRAAAQQVAERARVETLLGATCPVVGTAGIARAVITLGSAGGSKATLEQIQSATETLGINWVEGKRTGRSQAWLEPMMVGSAVLEAIVARLGAHEIAAEAETASDCTIDLDQVVNDPDDAAAIAARTLTSAR